MGKCTTLAPSFRSHLTGLVALGWWLHVAKRRPSTALPVETVLVTVCVCSHSYVNTCSHTREQGVQGTKPQEKKVVFPGCFSAQKILLPKKSPSNIATLSNTEPLISQRSPSQKGAEPLLAQVPQKDALLDAQAVYAPSLFLLLCIL